MKKLSLIPILLVLFFYGCKKEAIVFSKKDSPIRITEELVIEEGDSLIIEAGAEVLIDTGVSIISHGNIMINGTVEEPVHIKSSNPDFGWGVLKAKGSCEKFYIENAIIEGGLLTSYQSENRYRNVTFKNRQNLVWNDAIARFWYGSISIENCTIEGINKGEGFLLHNVQEPSIKNCTFRKIPDAIEYIDCRNGEIIGNHFENCGDDAIDQNSCFNTLIKDNRIFNAKDCGMELGSEKFGSSDSLRVINNLIVGCGKGIIVKESSLVLVEQSTFYNNKIGIEVHTSPDSSRVSRLLLSRSVISGQTNPVLSNERSDVQSNKCLSEHLLPSGENNLTAPVEFEDVRTANYKIISPDLPEGITIKELGYQHKE